MGSIESGESRKIISIETFRALGASRNPDKIEALAHMPSSSLDVLSRFRPPVEITRYFADSDSNPTDLDPFPPAA